MSTTTPAPSPSCVQEILRGCREQLLQLNAVVAQEQQRALQRW
jgi:hypothetical protein